METRILTEQERIEEQKIKARQQNIIGFLKGGWIKVVLIVFGGGWIILKTLIILLEDVVDPYHPMNW